MAPITPAEPVADIGAVAALQMTGGPHPHADDTDRRLLQRDRETRLRILAVRGRLLADAQAFLTAANASGGAEIVFLITTWVGTVLGCCGMAKLDGEHPEIGYWLGVPFWGKGYATEAARAVIDHAFGDLGCEVIVGGARVSNPASRRVLQKCGFEWTGVGLYRIRALASSAPVDRFRLERGLWASLKSWGKVNRGT